MSKSSSLLSNSHKSSIKLSLEEASKLTIPNKTPYLTPIYWKELIRLEEDFRCKKFDFQCLDELIQLYAVNNLDNNKK